MTVDELKVAITLLRIFKYEDLLSLQQVLINQSNIMISQILPKKKGQLIRILSRKDDLSSVINDINTDIDELYVSNYANCVRDIQLYINKCKDNILDVLKTISSSAKLDFDNNIFNLSPGLKTIINNAADSDILAIYAIKSSMFLDTLMTFNKYYISQIQVNNAYKDVHLKILSKIDKVIWTMVDETRSIINMKNSIQTMIASINNAKWVVETTGYAGADLTNFLSQDFVKVRSELGV
jgi:hypothetical protein